jgi:hypothetical protein
VAKIKAGLSGRRFPDVITDLVDDRSGSIGIAYDTAERLPGLAQLGRLPVQKIQSRARIVARATDWLRDFVYQRGRELSHPAKAVQVCEI